MASGGVTLVLQGPEKGGVGRPVQVRVEIRNDGEHAIWMVGVIDGSEDGVRFPRFMPSVKLEGKVAATPPPPEDPLVGPLRAADFRRLAPGESFDPTRPSPGSAFLPLSTFANFVPSTEGVYRYELELSTESDGPERWLGRFNQDEERSSVLELLDKVPRVRVTAALQVEVR